MGRSTGFILAVFSTFFIIFYHFHCLFLYQSFFNEIDFMLKYKGFLGQLGPLVSVMYDTDSLTDINEIP